VEEIHTNERQVVKAHVVKRRRTRLDVTLPVKFTNLKGEFRHARTKNISTGGAYICNKTVMMPVGVYTDLCIDIPGEPPILVYAQVVWNNRYGFGVRFVRLDPNDKDKIRNLIRNNGKITF